MNYRDQLFNGVLGDVYSPGVHEFLEGVSIGTLDSYIILDLTVEERNEPIQKADLTLEDLPELQCSDIGLSTMGYVLKSTQFFNHATQQGSLYQPTSVVSST